MTSEAQKRAILKYDSKNTKQLHLKLNINTDADILECLDKQESVQGYIKRLIRNDMQGPVSPKVYPETRYNGELIACGDCRHELIQKKPNFCPYCGKPIKWE